MEAHELEKLYRALNDAEPSKRIEAVQALAEMREAGAAVLARALLEYPWLEGMEPRFLENFYDRRLSTYPKSQMVPNVDAPPFHAMQGLILNGAPALPEVLRLLAHERREARLAAIMMLYRITLEASDMDLDKPAITQALLPSLRAEESSVRIMACWILSFLKRPDASAFSILVENYRKAAEAQERDRIVKALILMLCPAEIMNDIVAAHIGALDERNRTDYFSLVVNAGNRENATFIVPLMMHYIYICQAAQFDSAYGSARTVAGYLGRIGSSARDAILELARHAEPRFRDVAFEAIKEFPKDEDCRMFAAFLLDRLEPGYVAGEPGGEAENLLICIRNGHGLYPDDEARWSELQRRRNERLSSAAFLDELIRDLHSGDQETIWQATLKAKQVIDRNLGEIAPHLLHAMGFPNSIASRCTDVLQPYAPRLAHLASDLVAMLENTQPDSATIYLSATQLLRAMGPQAAPMTLRLTRLLLHESPVIRRACLSVLGAIGPAGLVYEPGLVDALTSRLRDVDERVCVAAASALGEFGAAARPAAPMLMAAARANTAALVGAARRALVLIASDKAGGGV